MTRHALPGAWVASLALLLGTQPGRAQEPLGDGRTAVSSNQGAALDPVAPYNPVGQQGLMAAHAEAGVLQRPQQGDPDADPASAAGLQQAPLPAGPLPQAGQRSKTPLGTKPVAWYRSGMVSLVVVLAAVGGVALLFRRFVPSVRAMSGGTIEVLGRNHLSPKQSLTLVRVGRRVLLIGVTGERLSRLCEIDDPDEVAELLVRQTPATRGSFDRVLTAAASGFGEPRDGPGELIHGSSQRLTDARGQLQGLLGRLKGLQHRQ